MSGARVEDFFRMREIVQRDVHGGGRPEVSGLRVVEQGDDGFAAPKNDADSRRRRRRGGIPPGVSAEKAVPHSNSSMKSVPQSFFMNVPRDKVVARGFDVRLGADRPASRARRWKTPDKPFPVLPHSAIAFWRCSRNFAAAFENIWYFPDDIQPDLQPRLQRPETQGLSPGRPDDLVQTQGHSPSPLPP